MGGKTKLGGLLSQKGPCNFPNLPPFLLGGNMGKWRSVACQKILCVCPPNQGDASRGSLVHKTSAAGKKALA